MKKVLITGGAGTVGKAFIKKYYNDFEFFNISRNESQIAKLARKYPKVTNFIGDIKNLELMINMFESSSMYDYIWLYSFKYINH